MPTRSNHRNTSAINKERGCFPEVINDLVRTPAIRRHLAPEARKLRLLGFDVRTDEQKREDERQKKAAQQWSINQLASRYSREEIYEQIWSEPIQHVAKKYNVSDVYLARVCKKLNIPRPDAVIGPRRQPENP